MSELSNSIWYCRGKRARSSGKPRTLLDGRISTVNREAWARGWDWQDNYFSFEAEDSETRESRLAEHNSVTQQLSQWMLNRFPELQSRKRKTPIR